METSTKNVSPRFFAVIPAAGRSARMGTPKLLLRWGDRTLLEHVLEAWRRGGIERRIVVSHRDDRELAALARQAGAEVVIPETPPPEMKFSVQYALEHIAARDKPSENDAWLLAPADMPSLDAEVIRAVCAAAPAHPGKIVAPAHEGRRGHPVLFPWPLAAEVRQLGPEEGINRLLQRHPVLELPVSAATILQDVDTPEDYRRLTGPQAEGREL